MATVDEGFEERLTSFGTGYALPFIEQEPGGLTFRWPEYELEVKATRGTRDGQAHLAFWADTTEYKRLLDEKEVKLLSSSQTASLIRGLKSNTDIPDDIPWSWILASITHKLVEDARQVELKKIWPSAEGTLEPEYLIEPLLYKNHPNVVFGDYGSAKSTLALAIAYIAQLPLRDNDLGLITGEESTICLYADYEDDPSSFEGRWSAIQRGFGIDAPMPILYQRMTLPIADAVDQLRETMLREKVALLIVDSLGPAARGNLNDPEPAIRYHSALRQLGVTSLTLAHTAKDQMGSRRTIFGSVYFTNLARSIWECKAEQEAGEDEVIISLKHHKANLSRLHPPVGYRFTFTGNSIAIARADLRDTGLSGELPLPWQIKSLLRDGPLTALEMVGALRKGENTIKPTLTRMAKRGELVKLPEHRWGLKHES